jgi:Ser/Thr protein kinase RdoA (MazF antagonist)
VIINNKIISINSKKAILFEYIKEENKNLNLGELLADYHLAVKDFDQQLKIRNLKEELETNLIEIKEKIKYSKDKKYLEKQLLQINNFIRDYNEFEQLIIHGDFRTDNIKGNRLLDFDNIMYGAKIFDICKALYYLIHRKQDLDITKKFLKDYESKIKLTNLEKKHLKEGIKLVILRKLVDRNYWDNKQYHENAINLLKWFDKNDIC